MSCNPTSGLVFLRLWLGMGMSILRSNYLERLLHSNRRQDWRCHRSILILTGDLWHVGWDLAEVSTAGCLGDSRGCLAVESLLSSISGCLRISIYEVTTTLSVAGWVTVTRIETLIRDDACRCWICCLVLRRCRRQSCILGRRTPGVKGRHGRVERDQVESRQVRPGEIDQCGIGGQAAVNLLSAHATCPMPKGLGSRSFEGLLKRTRLNVNHM